jgi:hypothetical protein
MIYALLVLVLLYSQSTACVTVLPLQTANTHFPKTLRESLQRSLLSVHARIPDCNSSQPLLYPSMIPPANTHPNPNNNTPPTQQPPSITIHSFLQQQAQEWVLELTASNPTHGDIASVAVVLQGNSHAIIQKAMLNLYHQSGLSQVKALWLVSWMPLITIPLWIFKTTTTHTPPIRRHYYVQPMPHTIPQAKP